MAEYIEREALINDICKGREPFTVGYVIRKIKRQPAADVVPMVHSKWIPTEAPFMNEAEDCSACGYRTVYGCGWGYCPNCGAKMDGGADNATD